MGTSVAPSFAILFLGIAELKAVKIMDPKHFKLNKRYVDDGCMIWDDLGRRYSFNRYLTLLTKFSGLKFTFDEHDEEAVMLDLVVFWRDTRYLTRTYQKELNLHLYVPASSSHPPGILKGIVYGRVLKFWKQNSLWKDFADMCQKLFFDLQARGYAASTLVELFTEVITRIRSDALKPPAPRQLFLKIPYDPYGPSRKEIMKLVGLDSDVFQQMLEYVSKDKVTICYQRPRNLRDILAPTSRCSNPRNKT